MNKTALQDYLSIENLIDILFATQHAINSKGIDALIEDKLSLDGILYRIEVMGEVAKNLSEDFKNKFSEIKWGDIARTRDIIVHHYHDIDPEIIKKILEDEIPFLLKFVDNLKEASLVCLTLDDQEFLKINKQ